ncbi:MAG: signal peptidase II [Gammaproteobacteria bacterium TMED183]|nr:signal peptidase II [SAR116 cluster bacterium]OUW36631.1 MAG: signal peptidase II [Gammaproteobacteria bacterium TMED183]
MIPAEGVIRQVIGLYALAVLVMAVDAATKVVALETLFYPPRVIDVLPFFRLVPVWNNGISFGMLQDAGVYAPLILGGFAVIVGLALPYYTKAWGRAGRLGGQMMAGGAFGNALDRLIYGRVVDFIDLYAGQWHWPAFNVADTAITIGAGLILLSTLGNKTGKDRPEGDSNR